MKILVRNVDNVVVYAEDALTLSATETTGEGWRSPLFSTANATILDATLPALWSGGVWTYIGGEWAVHDETRYATLVEAARIAAVPASVSPRQIRQALTAAGLRASVEAAVAASDQDTKDWYEFSTAFERSHPAVVAMGIGLGVSSDALDDLWIAAGAL